MQDERIGSPGFASANPKLALVPLAMLALLTVTRAAPTVIDFEDLGTSTMVRDQYAARGVVVETGAIVDETAIGGVNPAHSGIHVLTVCCSEFAQPPLALNFTAPQARVKLFAGSFLNDPEPIAGTLRAFNRSGAVVAADGPKPVVANAVTTSFEVKLDQPSIARVELTLLLTSRNEVARASIDDLEFEGEAAPSIESLTPKVTIATPKDGSQFDGNDLSVSGTVTGRNLQPTVQVSIDPAQPANRPHRPGRVYSVSLGGNGPTETYGTVVPIPLGPVTLRVEARNTTALTGAASVVIWNLPAVIRTRLAARPEIYGNLQWALSTPACQIAVFERGAIAKVGANALDILGQVFEKWLAWALAPGSKAPNAWPDGAPGSIFCPTANERIALGEWRAQDFLGGRIYADEDQARFVPKVFAAAIDKLGGESVNGVPLADPSRSVAARTWLFQQFARPGVFLPSTFEIKGSPPRIFIERQGGDLKTATQPTQSTATLATDYACTANEGPCSVPAPPAQVPRLASARMRGLCPDIPSGLLPEWKAILKDHTMTEAMGIVTASEAAEWDNPSTHEYNFAENGRNWSDWNIMLRLFPEYGGLLAANDELELEFEYYFAQHFFLFSPGPVFLDRPRPGDLLFASGRWILDCGHSPDNLPDYDRRTEIHPPFALSFARTVVSQLKPRTVSNVWVNGFYTGVAFTITLVPPPRPSPAHFLIFNRSTKVAKDVDVRFTFDGDNSSYVRAHFSASPRYATVTREGQMKWRTGRDYEAQWSLGWVKGNGFQATPLGPTWWP